VCMLLYDIRSIARSHSSNCHAELLSRQVNTLSNVTENLYSSCSSGYNGRHYPAFCFCDIQLQVTQGSGSTWSVWLLYESTHRYKSQSRVQSLPLPCGSHILRWGPVTRGACSIHFTWNVLTGQPCRILTMQKPD
jgi:hypothetical protein